MKEDRDTVLREAAVSAGIGLDELDGRVSCFGHRVGDAMLGVGEESGQMALQGLRGVDNRREARMRGPEVPAGEELLGSTGGAKGVLLIVCRSFLSYKCQAACMSGNRMYAWRKVEGL